MHRDLRKWKAACTPRVESITRDRSFRVCCCRTFSAVCIKTAKSGMQRKINSQRTHTHTQTEAAARLGAAQRLFRTQLLCQSHNESHLVDESTHTCGSDALLRR